MHQYKWNAEQETRSNPALVVVPVVEGSKVLGWSAMEKAQSEPVLAAIRAAMGTLNIEVRKVQYASFASEETNCFTADIYINGKKAGYAHNEGHGGPTTVEPHELSERLDVYGATLPVKVSNIADASDPTGFFTYQPDAENIVDDLIDAWLTEREKVKEVRKLERDLTCRLLYTKKGEKGIFQTKKLTPEQMKKYRSDAGVRRSWNVDVLLNDLPTLEAFKVYDANINRVYR